MALDDILRRVSPISLRSPALDEVAERASEACQRLLGDFFGDDKIERFQSLRRLEAVLDENFRTRSYFQVTAAAKQAWEDSAARMSPDQQARWGACLLSDLIAQAPQRIREVPLPDSVLPHILYEFSRILKTLNKPPEPQTLANDLFMKDLSICRLAGFPCVAQLVDTNSGIPRRLVAQTMFHEPKGLLNLGRASGFRYAPVFEAHTHKPMMRGFTPAGWHQCILLVADLLRIYPQYLGMTSGSWFYDPQMDRVSPTLSFLHQRPVDGGAFLLPMGQRPIDIQNATGNSESRRKLYEAGKYSPAAWLLVWPRQALLDWADANPFLDKPCCGN